jgi:hypothetical protein
LAQEFQDAISMRYGLVPPDLPARCDGCDAPFTFQHALCCKKGGLVISCHNKIQDKLIHMAGKAMIPFAIRNEPLIRPGCIAEDLVALQRKTQLAPPTALTQS